MFPQPFINGLIRSMGQKSASALLDVMGLEAPVTVRVNPAKVLLDPDAANLVADDVAATSEMVPMSALSLPLADSAQIPYSKYGFVLASRPEFTFDPAFQTGAYYVQEASSMAVELVQSLIVKMRAQQPSDTLKVLDLCAAPGGKSTHILSLIRDIAGAFLVSNEVIQQRATVLAGNMVKWGAANVVVTNNDPADFKVLPSYFDVVFVDAPCSGEGMFRKDPRAVEEWSEEGVKTCAARQRRILADVWGSLKDGGLLVYSTCTFNRTENDDNVAWLALSYGAEPLVTEHLYPGRSYGEGFFFSIIRKHGDGSADPQQFFVHDRRPDDKNPLKQYKQPITFVKEGYRIFRKGNLLKAYPSAVCDEMLFVEQKLRTLAAGTAVATVLEGRRKGEETLIPEPDLALSEVLRRGGGDSAGASAVPEGNEGAKGGAGSKGGAVAESVVDGLFPEVELYDPSLPDPREKALRFLRRDPIVFPSAPKGYLLLTWRGIPLGFVKNIGNRCNSLWPQSWRIRTQG